MIDYNKIKEANELAIKCDAGIWYYFDNNRDSTYEYELLHKDAFKLWGTQSFVTNSIDELIAKLKELTQPQPKYKVGQEVWFIDSDESEIVLHNLIIVDINKYNGEIIYLLNGGWEIYEKYLYPSRQALIEAQIAYWQELLTKLHVESYEKASIAVINEHIKDTGTYFENLSCICNEEMRIDCPKCGDSDMKPPFEGEIKGLWTKELPISNGGSPICQHKSDGRFHSKTPVGYISSSNRLSFPEDDDVYHKCKKCGEYYK